LLDFESIRAALVERDQLRADLQVESADELYQFVADLADERLVLEAEGDVERLEEGVHGLGLCLIDGDEQVLEVVLLEDEVKARVLDGAQEAVGVLGVDVGVGVGLNEVGLGGGAGVRLGQLTALAAF